MTDAVRGLTDIWDDGDHIMQATSVEQLVQQYYAALIQVDADIGGIVESASRVLAANNIVDAQNVSRLSRDGLNALGLPVRIFSMHALCLKETPRFAGP